ncbi:MAG: hypothetical protein NVS9B10_14040 [Nevskia sp.]
MKIELFHSPGCGRCEESAETLKTVALRLAPALEWRDINVLDELDYAVQLGVLTLPAIAINGELVFAALPTERQLAAALGKYTKGDEVHGH